MKYIDVSHKVMRVATTIEYKNSRNVYVLYGH